MHPVTQNDPKNHHYVPQHFLRAWATKGAKVYRYRRVAATGRLEVREVGIRKTASKDDLYRASFEDGSFEIESSIITPTIDQDGHKIIAAARSETIAGWDSEKRRRLANYLTCLEARHPDVLEAMDVRDRLENLRAQMKADGFASEESVDEVIDYFKASSSLGVLALGLFAQNESRPSLAKPFAEGLMDAHLREYVFTDLPLLSSSYPMARWGDYITDIFSVIALSPNKALIYSSSRDVDVFSTIPNDLRSSVINLYTLAKAESAYFYSPYLDGFVDKHLGWAKTMTDISAQRAYIGEFIKRELVG